MRITGSFETIRSKFLAESVFGGADVFREFVPAELDGQFDMVGVQFFIG